MCFSMIIRCDLKKKSSLPFFNLLSLTFTITVLSPKLFLLRQTCLYISWIDKDLTFLYLSHHCESTIFWIQPSSISTNPRNVILLQSKKFQQEVETCSTAVFSFYLSSSCDYFYISFVGHNQSYCGSYFVFCIINILSSMFGGAVTAMMRCHS